MEHNFYFAPASKEHQAREKKKAQELRKSQWWKQELGKAICYHCEQRFPVAALTMDHLIPIVRGGLSTKNNCVVSCKECNSKKSYLTRAELVLKELGTSGDSI